MDNESNKSGEIGKDPAELFPKRVIRLIFGLFLYALGIVITLKANIGYAPWDVFNDGIVRVTGISFGMASVVVGAVICVVVYFLGEKLGFGTILNMLLIGVFIDILMYLDFLPLAGGLDLYGRVAGALMLAAGLFTISVGSYFYIGSGFSAGPRDSLMVALRRKTSLPVGICRSTVELLALAAGWLMGGMAGVGTFLSMFAIGLFIQFTFRIFKFKPEMVKHEALAETCRTIRDFFRKTL